jgi:hypothetical protein
MIALLEAAHRSIKQAPEGLYEFHRMAGVAPQLMERRRKRNQQWRAANLGE